jgi:hypothetical protein
MVNKDDISSGDCRPNIPKINKKKKCVRQKNRNVIWLICYATNVERHQFFLFFGGSVSKIVAHISPVISKIISRGTHQEINY